MTEEPGEAAPEKEPLPADNSKDALRGQADGSGIARRLPLTADELRSAIDHEKRAYPESVTTVNEPANKMDEKPWILRTAAGLIILLAVVGFFFLPTYAAPLKFSGDALNKAIASLGSFFIIALFVERAQQIYVAGWRGVQRATLDRRVARWQKWSADASHYPDAGNLHRDIAKGLNQAELELAIFRQRTRKYVLLIGLALGVLIATTGPRIFAEIVVTSDGKSYDNPIFAFADILLTGGLIGGGSEAIHKIMVLVTDTLDQTRKNVTAT